MQRVSRGSKTEVFQHEAVLYEGLDDLASTTVPFIREGLERQEPVLVAVLPDRIRTLRSALGSDADRVEFLDIEEFGGWETVSTEFFDPENGSVAAIEQELGVPTG